MSIEATIEATDVFVAARDRFRTGPCTPRGLLKLDVGGGPKCGVYFLIRGRIVVYVGSSANILSRLADHCQRLEFDKVRWQQTSAEMRQAIEAEWIRKLKPVRNGYTDSKGIRRYCEPKPRATS